MTEHYTNMATWHKWPLQTLSHIHTYTHTQTATTNDTTLTSFKSGTARLNVHS